MREWSRKLDMTYFPLQSMIEIGSYGFPPEFGATGRIYNIYIYNSWSYQEGEFGTKYELNQSMWFNNTNLSECFDDRPETRTEIIDLIKKDGKFLATFLVFYLDQLLFIVLFSLLIQLYVVYNMTRVKIKNRKWTFNNVFSLLSCVFMPVKMFWTSYKIQTYLRDPDKEHVENLADPESNSESAEKAKEDNRKHMEDFMLYKTRFSGHITEGFIESQSCLRIQVSSVHQV